MKFSTGVVLAGLLLFVSGSGVPTLSAGVAHHEVAVVWPLFFSAILLSATFALCQTASTAPWMWQVINSVVSGLLAMQWCTMIADYEPPADDAFSRLVVWVVTYLVVCGFLYVLAASGYGKVRGPTLALAWFVSTVAGGFCSAALPEGFDGHPVALGLLLVEQLIFYFIWILPRTMEMGIEAWNIRGVRLGVPGCKGAHRPEDPIAMWRADCDSICWGAAPFAFATTSLRLLAAHHTQDPSCSLSDPCSWHGKNTLWLRISGSFLLATLIFARPLSHLRDSHGVLHIVGSTLLSGLTTAASMSFLNFLRAEISSQLCSRYDMCDLTHQVFLKLMVAYMSTVIAMLSAMVMPRLEAVLTDKRSLTILQCCQNSVGQQAGLAWYGAFSAAVGSGGLDQLASGTGLALVLMATIGPLYVYYIGPANDKVQDDAKAAKAAHAAKAA